MSGKLKNVETHYWKLLRKKGYNCPVNIRVRYSETSDNVLVEKVGLNLVR